MQDKRIPEWVLPDSVLIQAGLDTEHRNRPRPDILIVQVTPTEMEHISQRLIGTLTPNLGSEPRQIWIVEGGYGSDTRYLEKVAENQRKHAQLRQLLESTGYKVHNCPFIMGVGGTVFKSNLDTLTSIGVDKQKSNKLLSRLHIHAVQSLNTIVKQRRLLEHQQGFPRRRPP